MKNFFILLSCLTFTGFAAAQEIPGWGQSPGRDPEAAAAYLDQLPEHPGASSEATVEEPVTGSQASRSLGEAVPTTPQRSLLRSVTPGGNEADLVTPEIASLAEGLRNDPVKIFEYVRNYIKYECYYGSKKGAHLTLMEGSGNDFDQAALLVALLRAAGQDATYQYGPYIFSYTQLVSWWGLSSTPFGHLTDAQFLAEYSLPAGSSAAYIASRRKWLTVYEAARTAGFNYIETYTSGGAEYATIPICAVKMTVGGTNRIVSPAYKLHTSITGINLTTATAYNRTNMLSAAGGTSGLPDYVVKSLDEAAMGSLLTTYSTNLTNALRTTHDSKSLLQITGGKIITYSSYSSLTAIPALTADPVAVDWCPPVTWTAIPTAQMSKLAIKAGVFNNTTKAFTTLLYTSETTMPSLAGKKVSLSFSGNTARVMLDETAIGSTFTVSGNSTYVQLEAKHNHYTLVRNDTNGVREPSDYTATALTRNNKTFGADYFKGNTNAYAFAYSFGDPSKQLRKRQETLDSYRRLGYADTDWRVLSEGLNVMGLTYYQQMYDMDQMAQNIYGINKVVHHLFGRASQEGAFYIDVGLYLSNNRSPNIDWTHALRFSGVTMMFASAMEHGVLEQIQGQSQQAVSTVRMIQKANASGLKIYRATAANWNTTIKALLPTFSTTTKNEIGADLTESFDKALIPESATMTVNEWTGSGYAIEREDVGKMLISEHFNGGYSASDVAYFNFAAAIGGYTASPGFELSASSYFNAGYTPLTTNMAFSWDPIEMASGAYYLDKSDLALGGPAPLGLEVSRQYHSNRRYDNSSGLGYGWTHSGNVFITERSAPDASLGSANSYQAVPLLTALIAAKDLHSDHTTAKQWASAALVVHWGLEQMRYKAVSVTIGARSIQFIKMPDGTYAGPPGMNFTLTKSGSNYVVTERHGNVMTFDSSFRLSTVKNTSGATQTYGYSGTPAKLTTITDAFSRVITFTWSGSQIGSISDGTGRSVSFGYTAGDMTSFTDPEGKTWTYHYDADHRMDWLKDPQNRLLAENDYDSESRVIRQRSMGDANREWTYFYTGYVNTEIDPLGGASRYFHDERGRSTGQADPLGNDTYLEYDGQDRTTLTSTPKFEDTFRSYNADNTVATETDPKSKITRYYYDGQLHLQRVRDKRGKDTTFTYTTAHLLETVTDPLLHITTYGYWPNGQLKTVKDAENKTTTTGYDSKGSVNKITYNDSKFSSATNNDRGDTLTFTDPENRTVTKTWNKRRQLLTSTLPTIPGEPAAVTTYAYDDSGNIESETDAKTNVTSYTYNSLGKSKTTTMPALPAGGNVVEADYDYRDLLTGSTNSLLHHVTYGFDAARRQWMSKDALERTTENTLDDNGRITETKDPLLRITKQAWNLRGEKEGTTDGMNKSATYVFDENGNQTDYVNRRGKLYKSVFDDANRLQSTTSPTLKATSTTYYDNNKIKTIQEASTQTTTLVYNARNLVETKTDPAGVISYIYDDSGLLRTATQGSDVLTRTYNERGMLKTFTNADGDLLQYRYDANGNLARITYPDLKEVNYTYNSRNLLETVTDWANRTTTYSYDRLGRLSGITRGYNGTSASIKRDAADQLLEIKESANGFTFSYLKFGYDAGGQIKSRLQAPTVRTAWQHPSITATYDDDNRLATVNGATVVHDPDGNMTSGPLSGTSGNLAIGYNSRNQLTSLGDLSFSYDSEGNRRTSTDTSGLTRFTIDPNAALSRLLVKHAPGGVKTYYVYGLGLLYEVNDAGATKTYHYDQVGSTIARTDDTGKVIGQATYSAYGLVTWQTGDMNTPFLYNGQSGVMTEANGVLNMRARYYSPYLMRFLNADPSGFSGGSNWFAYSDGNPISKADPFGLKAADDDLWGQIKDAFNGLGESMANAMFDPQGAMVSGVDKTIDGAFQPVRGYIGHVEPFKEMGSYQEGSFADNGGAFMSLYMNVAGGYLVGRLGEVPMVYNAETAGMSSVSRWGRAGLQAGDFVMDGEANAMNYFKSGKWQPGMGNEFAPFSAGEQFLVPSTTLRGAAEASTATIFDKGPFGWVKDQMGQRTFSPNIK